MEPGSKSLVDLESQGTDRSIVREEAEDRVKMFSLEKGDWNSMLEFLKEHGSRPTILHPVSTEFKDTIVHAAAALGQKDVVKDLLVRIKEMNLETSLGVLLANQLGNNPLHSAALMGQVDTVRVIFDVVPDLASARNIYGETPIFQAAVSGSIQVFSELASKLPPGINDIINMLRRNDGDTILHCALSGEYFGSYTHSVSLSLSLSLSIYIYIYSAHLAHNVGGIHLMVQSDCTTPYLISHRPRVLHPSKCTGCWIDKTLIRIDCTPLHTLKSIKV